MTSPSANRHKRLISQLPGQLLAGAMLLVSITGCSTPVHQTPRPAAASEALEQQRQQALALHARIGFQQRLARIALPLQRAAVPFCPKPAEAALGIRLANQHFFAPPFRDSAIRELGLGQVLEVTAVLPDSPAAAAGVQVGDHLVRIDQQEFPVGEQAPKQLGKLLERLQPDTPITLELERAQTTRLVSLTPAAVCRYPLVLVPRDEINAYATHRSIEITRGLLNFAQDDWDLAFVIAHELAHNLLGHVPATITNGALGSLVDLWLLSNGIPSPGMIAFAGSRIHSQGFEAEADQLALYLMVRAGWSLDHDADYWRRVAALRPETIDGSGSTHPDSSRRYLAMQQTLAEIRRQQAAGEPLLPPRRGTDGDTGAVVPTLGQ